ncbi:hypothetical protein [Actinomadura sp. 6N118]|uniref:hypothetical protein n=1 Tax=Actinomadura sp. 6N118 TaxID=3375151 RepID=UPI0037BA9343
MSDTLTRDPLLMARSFTDGHVLDPDFRPPADQSNQPLAYLYSKWDGVPAAADFGYFDDDTQTWVSPPGMPTAGTVTYTRTYCYNTDSCYDDSCA